VALKFNKQSLEDFHERLSSVDASWQEDFNLKEIVRKSLKPISKARRYKVSWEKIALMLQEATGGELEISAASVRKYYFELMEKPSRKEKEKTNKTNQKRNANNPKMSRLRIQKIRRLSQRKILGFFLKTHLQYLKKILRKSFQTPKQVLR
jgi:dTDP-4-dehydrorhamnose reductase